MDTLEELTTEGAPQWPELCKLVGIAADWAWELDRDYRYSAMHGRNIFALSDAKQQSLIGKRPWETGLEIKGSQDWQDHQVQLSEGKPFRNLLVQKRYPDGKVLYAHISGAPHFDSNGEFVGYRGIGVDVTERQLADLEHIWFSAVVDNSPDSILITDIDTQTFLYCNKYAYTSRGITKEEQLATHPGVLTGLTPTQLAVTYQETIAAGEKGIMGEPYIVPDVTGRRLSYRQLYRKAINVDGRWILSTVSRDVTPRILAEEATALTAQMYEARCAVDDLVDEHLKFEEIAYLACQRIAKSGQFANATILLKNAENDYIEVAASTGTGSTRLADYKLDITKVSVRQETGRSVIEEAFYSRRAAVCTKFESEPSARDLNYLLDDKTIRSVAAFPLPSHSEPVGVVVLFSKKRRAFNDKCIEIGNGIGLKLSNALSKASFEKEAQDAHERISHMNTYDPLTGLPNTLLFDEILRMEVANSVKHKLPFTIFVIELDKGSNLNATLGNAATEQLVCIVAIRLRACLRRQITITRLGNNRFVVLAPDTALTEDAESLAQRMLSAINQPMTIQDQVLCSSASIGISIVDARKDIEGDLLGPAQAAATIAMQEKSNSIIFASTAAEE